MIAKMNTVMEQYTPTIHAKFNQSASLNVSFIG